jgi:hypothetical protein
VNDNDEYSGGSRTQLSPEAISDFQIVNHGFAAESGGGAGGSIDVQTRSGVNRIHGDAFTFVQNGALNGTPPLGLNPYKPDESRVRAGVALGGPIQRDKMFYYVAAEQGLARGEDTNDLEPATLSSINTALKQHGPLSNLTLQSGFFPTTDQEIELSGRADRTLSTRQAVMLRYAFTNSRNVSDAFHTDELTDRTARGSSFIADNSLNGTLTSTLTETLLNKLSSSWHSGEPWSEPIRHLGQEFSFPASPSSPIPDKRCPFAKEQTSFHQWLMLSSAGVSRRGFSRSPVVGIRKGCVALTKAVSGHHLESTTYK